jgi:purine-cytosine permease-like protein
VGVNRMKNHAFAILPRAAASVARGAIFIVALIRQFALVEVAACLFTGLLVFLLSSSIVDLLEARKNFRAAKVATAISLVVSLVILYFVADFRR